MERSHVLACVALIGLAGVVAAGTIELDLEDEHGTAVRRVRCGIVDPRTGAIRVTFDGPRYDGPIVPRNGDRLYAYRRGFDLFSRTLVAGDVRIAGTLVRTSDRCRVVLAPDAEIDDAPVVEVVSVPSDLRRKSRPVKGGRTFRLAKKAVMVLLPRGMDTSFFVKAPGRLPWPVTYSPQPDETCTIRLERERAVRVRYPDPIALGKPNVLCLPDYQWQPRAEATRIDAWRWYLNGPGWLTSQFENLDSVVRICPDVPFHLFAQIDGVPRYRKIGRDQQAAGDPQAAGGAPRIDLTAARRRRVQRRPTIGGTAVREGAIIAPGLLDRRSITRLIDYFGGGGGDFFLRAGPPAEAWLAPRLPAARWLTVWEPGHGVAHLAWAEGDRPLDGPRATGVIECRLAAGVQVVGHAAVYSVWNGGRTVRTVPPLERLRRPFVGRSLVFRGLPPGHYAVSLDVRLTDRAGRALVTRNYTECETGAILELPLVRR